MVSTAPMKAHMKPWAARGLVVFSLSSVVVACSSDRGRTDDGASDGTDPNESPPASGTTTPAATSPTPPGDVPCKGGIVETCSAFDTRSYCVESSGKRTWKEEKCAAGCFAGKCDWRLPEIDELRGLISVPYPDCTVVPCTTIIGPTAPTFYWTRTHLSTEYTRTVSFGNGIYGNANNGLSLAVRAVRTAD